MTLKGNRFEVIDKEESNQRSVLQSKETQSIKCLQKGQEAKAHLAKAKAHLAKQLLPKHAPDPDLHMEAAVHLVDTTLTKLLLTCL